MSASARDLWLQAVRIASAVGWNPAREPEIYDDVTGTLFYLKSDGTLGSLSLLPQIEPKRP